MLIALIAGSILALASSSRAAELPDETFQIGGAQIEVRFEEGTFSVTPAAMRRWIAKSATAVTEYYGRFPVGHLHVVLVPLDRGTGVVFGRTFVPGPTPVIRVLIGAVCSEDDLHEDWVMTHEMVHLAFPSVPEKQHWIEEGIATYVEPIARAQIGDLTSAKVWRDMVDGMRHGLPAAGDRGLDNTHTWGRTYWGGAMFCLLADVEIHRRTHNRFGLQDALRAIMRSGTMLNDWPLARALKVGDDAVGVPVLTELYAKMKDAPYDPNLPALFQGLGVKAAGESVTFDPTAPDASIVISIMRPRATGPKEKR
jgi:hypothetical protein